MCVRWDSDPRLCHRTSPLGMEMRLAETAFGRLRITTETEKLVLRCELRHCPTVERGVESSAHCRCSNSGVGPLRSVICLMLQEVWPTQLSPGGNVLIVPSCNGEPDHLVMICTSYC